MIHPIPQSLARPHRVLRLSFVSAALLALVTTVLPVLAAPAEAAVTSIHTRPGTPTTCDSVALLVGGVMPDPCYQIIGAAIDGPVPLPTMGPVPTYGIRVRITVREPNPNPGVACPAVLQPYERAFVLGRLHI